MFSSFELEILEEVLIREIKINKNILCKLKIMKLDSSEENLKELDVKILNYEKKLKCFLKALDKIESQKG